MTEMHGRYDDFNNMRTQKVIFEVDVEEEK